jgi:hypothetical protein
MNRWSTPSPSARLLLAATGWLAVLAATELPAGSAGRLAVIGLFVFLGPGAALQLPLRPALLGRRRIVERRTGAVESWMLAGLLSVSALVLVAVGLMMSGGYSALTTLVVLAVITTVGALTPSLRDAAP